MPIGRDYDPTDPAWFAANRQGQLAPEQHALLREHALFSTLSFLFSLITTVPLTMIVGGALGIGLARLVGATEAGQEVAMGLGALGGLLAVARLRLTDWPDLRAWRDLRAGR